jgi:quinol monooxygenase YgiN
MHVALIRFRAQPHKRSELLSAADSTVERMRQTSGCGRCRLLVDTEDPNSFTIVSEWQHAHDADAFFDSREFQMFKGARILLREEAVLVRDEVASRVTTVLTGR